MVKVLEYMAMGKAIVQFPIREMRRVCGDTAVYAEDGDAADLALKLGELIDDPARRKQLSAAALQRARDLGLMWPAQVPTLLTAVERASALGKARLGLLPGDERRRTD